MVTILYSKKRLLFAVGLSVVLLGCHGEEECLRVGEQWCEGNRRVSCFRWQEDLVLSTRQMTTDCGDIELPSTCVEKQFNGKTRAACVVDETPCDKGQISMCRGDNLIVCGKTRYPEFDRRCTEEEMICAVNEAGSTAGCAYVEGLCTPGDRLCDSDDQARFYRCDNNGLWSQRLICREGDHCVSNADGGLGCGDGTSYDGGVEGAK